MKIAIIGLGHVAQYQIQALSLLTDFELTDAFDIEPEKAVGLPANVRVHDSLRSLSETQTAEVFLISTPVDTHYQLALELLRKGKNVAIEKPVSLSIAELETLDSLAEAEGRFLHVALHAAFARELEWWVVHRSEFEYGELFAFEAAFYDPYISEGNVLPAAMALGGSWIDSGINALSVVGRLIDPADLQLRYARMTSIPQLLCAQLQGSAQFMFSGRHRKHYGSIDTNWTLGLNEKTTLLVYEESDVLLHHSGEYLEVRQKGEAVYRRDFRTQHPRLTNHYVGVFEDLRRCFVAGSGNFRRSISIHKLLLDAMD